MRWVLAAVLVVHGLVHLMGPAKAFELAELPQLTRPISRAMGIVWLVAGVSMLATAAALFAWPSGWWTLGAVALVMSELVVVMAWHDAKFGTVANVVLFVAVLQGGLLQGPWSFGAEYRREAAAALARVPRDATVVTEADLAPLPEPVRRYLRATGFVGQPRVRSYRVRFEGRIRSGPSAEWMPFDADQQSIVEPPTRLFLMRATRLGLPIDAFHRTVSGAATMRVKVVGLVPVVDSRGPVLDRTETVTLFNDMCILAPGTLLSPRVRWEPIDALTTRAHFTNGSSTITATLHFDAQGLLTNFVSDDRSRQSSDGKTFTRQRFSTPVRDYRAFGPYRIAAHGEARWHPPEGDFAYGEFELVDVRYDEH